MAQTLNRQMPTSRKRPNPHVATPKLSSSHSPHTPKPLQTTFSLKQQNRIFAKSLKNQNSIIAEQPRQFSDGL
ncbi:hypothetical protein NEIFL0001_0184 [Neisseria flavescens SK114]|nr:hypothetical protein NEIFL0001_0184 [Neisseria flavescens SK114]